jgi:hypothetical protein
MEERTYFPAPWDNLVKGVTLFVILFLVSLIVMFSMIIDHFLVLLGIALLYGGVIVVPYFWAPQGYQVIEGKIIVKRLIGDVYIFIDRLPLQWKWTWWGIRLIGSGGLYGYFGFFTFRGIGRVRMYATNRHNLILIVDEKGKKILLSPKDPERFINLLQT